MIYRADFIKKGTCEKILSVEFEGNESMGSGFKQWREIKKSLGLGEDVESILTCSPANTLGKKLDALLGEVQSIREMLEPKHVKASEELTEKGEK